MLISTALLLDSIIRNSVCTPAKLPCRRVEVGYEIKRKILFMFVHQKCKKKLIYSRGQKKVGQVLLINLAKIALSKPGLL
jgi:hypothetical protein